MPEFAWQGFNQIEGGKPANNSLLHKPDSPTDTIPPVLWRRQVSCGEKTTTVCNCFVNNHTYWGAE